MPTVRSSTVDEVQEVLGTGSDVVVCVPVFEAYWDVVKCLNAILTYTRPTVPIVVLDDGSSDIRFQSLSATTEHKVIVWHRPVNLGFVASVNEAFDLVPDSDVVVVNSDVIVGPGWLDRLRDAAYSASSIATATPLTNHGTMLSVGHGRNRVVQELPEGLLPAQAAEAVARRSRQLRPLIPTAIGHCTYFRRDALRTVGTFDPIFSPGYSEEVDFSQRALAMGFVHVCADDVFVFHLGGSSFGKTEQMTKLQDKHHDIVCKRYPYYLRWMRYSETDPASPLAAAIRLADAALRGLRVMVDATNVGPTIMGTQKVVVESVRVLSRHHDVAEVIVVVPPSAAESALQAIRESGAGIVVSAGPEHRWSDFGSADIVYRPSQVTRVAELKWLLAAAPRVVINYLDCIAYNDPAYFDGWDRWKIYREANEIASRFADGVTYLSETSRRQSEMSGLVARGRVAVVYSGTDLESYDGSTKPPKGVKRNLSGFFLCLGASYKHKNRVTALRIFAEARTQGWMGGLVLAGPTPPEGNSLADEDEFLLHHPELRSSVVRLGALSEPEKEWLYKHAAVVLYPTLAEGFGLVPFEAAAHNVPCLSTRCGSLDEVLPLDIPTIDLGDIGAAARSAVKLADDKDFGKTVCASLNAKAREFTWDLTGDKLVELFWEVLGTPSDEDKRIGLVDSIVAAHSSRRDEFRLPARWFGRMYPTLSWSISVLVERPSLRQALLPRGSRRAKLASSLVRYIDRRTR